MAKVLLYTINDSGAAGLRILGAVLKERGHEVRIVLVEPDLHMTTTATVPKGFTPEWAGASCRVTLMRGFLLWSTAQENLQVPSSFKNQLSSFAPDIIGFSGRALLNSLCPDWFATIKQEIPQALLVAGGFGPSAEPEFFLEAGADLVIRGEGEEAICSIADCVDQKRPWTDIPNCAWKNGAALTLNPLRLPVMDLSTLPEQLLFTPEISYIKDGALYNSDPISTAASAFILTGRGCIGSCSYCVAGNWRNMYTEQGLHIPKYRARSLRSVLDEMGQYKRIGAKAITITDDFFIRSKKEMIEFFKAYNEEIALPFFANFHHKILLDNPDLIDTIDDAGLQRMVLAIQSPNEEFARQIFTRNNNNADYIALAYEFRKRKIDILFHLIDGVILNGWDTLEDILTFVQQIPPFQPPFPSLPFYFSKLALSPLAPLAKNYPEINSSLISFNEYLYRGMLVYFRYLLSDIEFAILRANDFYKENPDHLLPMLHAVVRDMHNVYIYEQANALAGQEIYFWGCGEIYNARKHLFIGTKPRAILVNVPTTVMEVDGLPVLQAADVLERDNSTLPVVIFSNQALNIARYLKRIRPDYPDDKIIACQTTM